MTSGAGTVVLSSANTFTGIAGVANNGTLRLSATGLSAGQYALNVEMLTHQQGAGTQGGSIDWYGNEQVNPAAVYAWSSGTSSLLNLRGFTQTLGGLVSSGATAMAVQNNLAATAGTLILDVPLTRSAYFNSFVRDQAGTLALVKRGEGTQVIDTAAANLTYTGGTTVEAGTLELRQAIPSKTNFTVAGGTLAVGVTNPVSGYVSTLDLRGGRVTGPGNLRVTSALTPRAGIFDKDVSTPLSFTKISDGTLDGGVLTVSSALTVGQGVATVSGGTLKVGAGGTTGQLNAAQIVNNGAVIFDRSNDFTLDSRVTGSGSFQKAGAGVMTVRAPIEVSGPTSITGGTLRLAAAGAVVTAPVAGASLWLDATDASSLVLSGSNVTTWNNKGTASVKLTGVNTASLTYNLTGGGLTDRAYVNLNGSNPNGTGLFNVQTLGGVNTSVANGRTFFVVYAPTATPNQYSPLFGRTSTESAYFNAGNNGSGYVDNTYGSTLSPGGGAVWYQNGLQIDALAEPINPAVGLWRLNSVTTTGAYMFENLGKDRNLANRNLPANIGEILVYDTALSASERATVEAYLSQKWMAQSSGYGTVGGLSATSALSVGVGATLDLAGSSQTVLSLSDVSGQGGTVTSSVAGAMLLTAGDGTDTVFSGVLEGGAGTLALRKTGLGMLTLAGNNALAGGVTVVAGALQIGLGGTSGSIGNASVVSDGAVIFNRSDALTYGGVVSGSGSFTKLGAGVLTLAQAQTYGGETTVGGGSLVLSAGAPLPSGSLTIGASATLDASAVGGVVLSAGKSIYGSGRLVGGLTVPVGASMLPGARTGGVGTLQTGELGLSGTMTADIAGTVTAGLSDRVEVAGNLSLGVGASLTLGDAGAVGGRYTVMTYTGARTGVFDSVTNPFGATLREKVVYGDADKAVYVDLFRLAAPGTISSPVMAAASRVGDVMTLQVPVTNTAGVDGFSEGMRASISNVTGDFSGTATVSGVLAGQTAFLSFGVNTALAGERVGTGEVAFSSDGAGTSGKGTLALPLSTQTVGLSAKVYRLAEPVVDNSAWSLGNYRVGDTVLSGTRVISNGAAADGYSDLLRVATGLDANGFGLTVTGGDLAAGSSKTVTAGFSGDNQTAGVQSASLRLVGTSVGQSGTGLVDVALAPVDLNLSATFYRKAEVELVSGAALDFGAIREGGSFAAKGLNLKNAAISTDAFSDDLKAVLTTTETNWAAAGVVGRIAAGSSSAALEVRYTGLTSAAGAVSGAAQLTYTSVGKVGTGLADVAPDVSGQALTLTGKIFRLATPSLTYTQVGGVIDLGVVRVGSSVVTKPVMLFNTSAGDDFSDLLRVVGTSGTGGFSIEAGADVAGGGSRQLGILYNGAVGATVSGTVQFGFASIGQEGTGLADYVLPASTQTLTLQGVVWRAANPVLSSNVVTLAPIREGQTFVSRSVGITNDVPNDGASERLNASFGTLTGDAIRSGGPIVRLQAGSTDGSMLVGISDTVTALAGRRTGGVEIRLATDGTGTSGLGAADLAPQVVTVIGDVYRVASGVVNTPSIRLAAIREGGVFAGGGISLSNVALADGYSEKLDASFGALSGQAVVSGALTGLVGGGTDSASMTLGLNSAGLAGSRAGSAKVQFFSNGAGTTELARLAVGVEQDVTVTGDIYRLAQPEWLAGSVDFGNVRLGATGLTRDVGVRNGALSDGYSDFLSLVKGSVSGGSDVVSVPDLLDGMGEGTVRIGFAGPAAVAGRVTGTVAFDQISRGRDGTGLADFGLGTKTVSTVVNVYRPAAPTVGRLSVDLGAVREGTAFPLEWISLTNAVVADGYSEALTASFGARTGDAFTNGGRVTRLGAGGVDLSTMAVGLGGVGVAGAKSGTVDLSFVSDGTGTSGLADLGLLSQQVELTGKVYRLATGLAPAVVRLAPVREGGSFAMTGLAVSNVSAADGYSETLNASFGGVSGAVLTNGAGVLRLGAGGVDGTMQVRLADSSAVVAGAKSGTVTIGYETDGAGTTGLGAMANGSSTVSVQGEVYRLATYAFLPGELALGNIRLGETFGVGAIDVRNASAGDGFSDLLSVSVLGVQSGFTHSGGPMLIEGGATQRFSIGYVGSTAMEGERTGNLDVRLKSVGQAGTGLADVDLGIRQIRLSATVYSPARGRLDTASIDLGNTREGVAFTAREAGVTNTVHVGGYSEKLDAMVGAKSDNVSVTGGVGLLGGQEAKGDAFLAYLTDIATAGLKSGSFTVEFLTNGQGTSGLAAESVGNGVVAVQGKVFRLARGEAVSEVGLAAIREGEQFLAKPVGVANTSAGDGFSDDLRAVISGSNPSWSALGVVERLAAGSGVVSSPLTVNYVGDTSRAGLVSTKVNVGYTSLGQVGTGLADAAPVKGSDEVSVTGKIFRLAEPVLDRQLVDLGNIRVGERFSSVTARLSNAAGADGYSDDLRIVKTVPLGSLKTDAAVGLIPGGGSVTWSIGFDDKDTQRGSEYFGGIRIYSVSSGQVGTGLVDVELPRTDLVVRARVFEPARVSLQPETISLGAVRAGQVGLSWPLEIANTAPVATGLMGQSLNEKLKVTLLETTGRLAVTGGQGLIDAGSVGRGLLMAVTGASPAGDVGGTVRLGLASDGEGTSGLAPLALGEKVYNVVGKVYRPAVAGFSDGPIQLGNLRAGSAFGTAVLDVSNLALADGYSDDLRIETAGTGAFGVTSPGLIRAGLSERLRISFLEQGAAAVGLKTGTMQFRMISVGQAGTNLADLELGSKTVEVTGTLYRPANGVVLNSALDFGNLREGMALGTRAVAVKNDVVVDDFSERLNAVVDVLAGIKVEGGRVTGLLPGATDTASLRVGLSDEMAMRPGEHSVVVPIRFETDGTGTSGLEAASIGSQNVTVSARVFRMASTDVGTNVVSGAVDLNAAHVVRVRMGAGAGEPIVASIPVRNTANAPEGFNERLAVSGSAADGRVSFTEPGLIGAGETGLLGVRYAGATAGLNRVDYGVSFRSDGTGTSGFAPTAIGGVVPMQLVAQLYTGQGVWAKPGISGAWSDWNAWTAEGGRPGLDGVLSRGVDTARLVGAEGAAPMTVRLDVSPSLSALSLSKGSVILEGEALSLGSASAEGAVVESDSGSHVVKVPVRLDADVRLDISKGAMVRLEGVVSGTGGMTKQGNGVAVLLADNTYSGRTLISAGTLQVGDGGNRGSLGTGNVFLAQGAELLFNRAGTVVVDNLIEGDGAISIQGDVRLTRRNTNTGGTRVSGELILSSAGLSGPIEIDGGTLVVPEKVARVSLNSTVSVVGAENGIKVEGASVATLTGVVTGARGLVKTGDGTLQLLGRVSYAGDTEIRAGRLDVSDAGGVGLGAIVLSGGTVLGSDRVVQMANQVKLLPTAGSTVGTIDVGGVASSSATVSLSGPITGNGGLVKTGLGVLEVSNVSNDYKGDTLVDAGTLRLKSGAVLGEGRLILRPTAELSVAGNTTLTNAVEIVGGRIRVGDASTLVLASSLNVVADSALVKEGEGTLTVRSAAGSVRGEAVISAGTLKLESAAPFATSTRIVVGGKDSDKETTKLDVSGVGLRVASNQVVQGRGTILGQVNLASGGAVKPGNSIDSLTISGGGLGLDAPLFTAAKGGVLEIEYNTTKAAGAQVDLLNVLGRVKLDGGLVQARPELQIPAGDKTVYRLPFLQSSAAIEGQFDGVQSTVLGVRASLDYSDPLMVQLVLQRGLSEETLNAMKALTDAYAHLGMISRMRTQTVASTLDARLRAIGQEEQKESGLRAWTNAYNTQLRGFGPYTSSITGDVTGIEKSIGKLTIGVFGSVGTSRDNFVALSGRGRTDFWHTGLYGSANLGDGWFADASAMFGTADNMMSQTLPGSGRRSSTFTSTEWLTSVGVGRAIETRSGWRFVPNVRLVANGYNRGATKETGASLEAMKVGRSSESAVLTRMGLEASKAAKIGKIPVRFIATVDYQHDFNADSRRATSRLDGFDNPVSSGPSRRRRDAIKVGGAIEGQIGDGKTMRIYGEQEMGGGGSKVTRFGVSFGIEF
jgi:autotransporter-associated beta strand protein